MEPNHEENEQKISFLIEKTKKSIPALDQRKPENSLEYGKSIETTTDTFVKELEDIDGTNQKANAFARCYYTRAIIAYMDGLNEGLIKEDGENVKRSICDTYVHLAERALRSKMHDEALENLEMAAKFSARYGDTLRCADILAIIGDILVDVSENRHHSSESFGYLRQRGAEGRDNVVDKSAHLSTTVHRTHDIELDTADFSTLEIPPFVLEMPEEQDRPSYRLLQIQKNTGYSVKYQKKSS